MQLHTLSFAPNSKKKTKRIGRGGARGGTSGRGHKGAQSRSGYSKKRGFEGGQMPLQRRIPKFGFKNPNKIEYKALNLDTLSKLIDKTNISVIDKNFLLENGLLSKKDRYKVLSKGEITGAVTVHAHKISISAKEKIEKVGGRFIEIVEY